MAEKVAVFTSSSATALASCRVTTALVPSAETAMYSGSTSSETDWPAKIRTPWARSASSWPLKALKFAVCTVALATPLARLMMETVPAAVPGPPSASRYSPSFATSTFLPSGVKVSMSGRAPTVTEPSTALVAASRNRTRPSAVLVALGSATATIPPFTATLVTSVVPNWLVKFSVVSSVGAVGFDRSTTWSPTLEVTNSFFEPGS